MKRNLTHGVNMYKTHVIDSKYVLLLMICIYNHFILTVNLRDGIVNSNRGHQSQCLSLVEVAWHYSILENNLEINWDNQYACILEVFTAAWNDFCIYSSCAVKIQKNSRTFIRSTTVTSELLITVISLTVWSSSFYLCKSDAQFQIINLYKKTTWK